MSFESWEINIIMLSAIFSIFLANPHWFYLNDSTSNIIIIIIIIIIFIIIIFFALGTFIPKG